MDHLNMRHQGFNIIFQPPKEATYGLKSVALNPDLTIAQLDAAIIQNISLFTLCV